MSLLRTTFIALSEKRGLRAFAEHSSLGRKLSRRFVAGTSMEDAIAVAQELNAAGIAVTLDALGENVHDETQAAKAAATYRALLEEIGRLQLNANVSLKLTQMGMNLPGGVAERIVADLGRQATAIGSFVRVDMEGSVYTQATIDLVRRIHAVPEQRNIGIVLQSYLRRTRVDMIGLLAEGICIRLCKGAYQEPAEIAFTEKAVVDANYVDLMKELLTSGFYHGLATHDERIIEQVKSFAAASGVASDSFEFQMLYGIRRDLQEQLVKQGYRVRVYVPFGKEWYPYFMRRLAERPANVLFIAKNLFR
jgi:proline dehydrogenase